LILRYINSLLFFILKGKRGVLCLLLLLFLLLIIIIIIIIINQLN